MLRRLEGADIDPGYYVRLDDCDYANDCWPHELRRGVLVRHAHSTD